ncbi:MAG: hypothetical protein COX62_06720 [Deltaproteobacteria bacterium CG_4_10_14_0_2_um_filter_43_8]|nr:MAG: hypothetical protein COV43_03140 [Deltaproteobacteria bacterium CG11_big_fil_rev_8_21_14_0_20_42_23]PJA19456.1 MAG: hypothetical protein COX62_06720 [Deltaproteobacteria bacterium CG_4_10_14_0_2_um_filter_43_8]PJC63772.1 MAG: hypothetical protein CO021_07755 [Deltaproteobacteria bacterium CG_4_9_14_0_2_um_filter_42_21]
MAIDINNPITSQGTVIDPTTMDQYFTSQIEAMKDQTVANGLGAGASIVSVVGQVYGMAIQTRMQESQFAFQEGLAGIEKDIKTNAETEKQLAIASIPEAKNAEIEAELRLQNAQQAKELIAVKTTELKKTEATVEAVTQDPRRAYDYGTPTLSIG